MSKSDKRFPILFYVLLMVEFVGPELSGVSLYNSFVCLLCVLHYCISSWGSLLWAGL